MNKWKKVRANKYCLYLNNNLDINLYLGDTAHILRVSTYFNSENHKEDLKTFTIEKRDKIEDVLAEANLIAIQVLGNKVKKYKNVVEECEKLIDQLREV